MFKKYLITNLTAIVAFLSVIFVANIVCDPFYHYSVPDDDSIYLYDEIYQNAGMLKNYDYDTLIIGSSMTENFRVSWFREGTGCKPLKTPFAGAFMMDIKNGLELAFQHGELKKVYLGLDLNMLISDPRRTRYDVPDYLYDTEILNDVKYLLNKTVFFQDTLQFSRDGNIDTAFNWGTNDYEFAEEAVIKKYKETSLALANGSVHMKSNPDYGIMQWNLDYLLHIIENHAETQFEIFFPPYSILYWYDLKISGDLENYLLIEEKTIEQLLTHNNVKVYYYQDLEEIILDLDNYHDYTHYLPKINQYIADTIMKGQNTLTTSTYKERINNLRKMAYAYVLPE